MLKPPVWCLVAALLFSSEASAQEISSRDRLFNIQRFSQAMGAGRFITVEPSVPNKHLSFSISYYATYAESPLRLFGKNESKKSWVQALVAHSVGISFGLFDRLQIGVAFPYTITEVCGKADNPPPKEDNLRAPNRDCRSDSEIGMASDLYGGGFNDMILSLKGTILRNRSGGLGLAVGVDLTLPIDSGGPFRGYNNTPDDFGESTRYIADNSIAVTVAPRLMVDFVSGPFRVAANLGARFQRSFVFLPDDDELKIGNEFLFGLGMDYRVLPSLTIVAEVWGATLLAFNGRTRETPLEALAAVRWRATENFGLVAGGGAGLVRGYGAGRARAFAGLTYDFAVGAKALKDSDGDGIDDSVDKCPSQAEDRDGFLDDDGCPDPDNDNDGVPDKQDKCPLVYAKTPDGCPAKVSDTDGDGINDNVDKCPTEPEDKDGFQDEDGCPDNDNDGDGIADSVDKCPNEPETVNGYKDADGCPDTPPKPQVKALAIPEIYYFDQGKTTLDAAAKTSLKQVAARIKAHPGKPLLRIEGHSDSSGRRRTNYRLSAKRAASVRAFLIKQGVPAKQLQAVGYGATRPLKPNTSDANRRLNRRVVIIVITK
ncbi:MAG: OmpA family protein [Myxococcales bacterium]|nr:OmpA family protein [Myxococcales bacterium]